MSEEPTKESGAVTALKWVKTRLSESSTITSLMAVAALVGWKVDPEWITQSSTLLVGVASFILFVWKDKK